MGSVVRPGVKSIAWSVILVLSMLIPGPVVAAPEPSFQFERFMELETTTFWLLAYDRAAWLSSDLVMQETEEELQRLGPEWFCFQSENRWHAVYGRYDQESDAYEVVFHYVATDDGFEKTDSPVDPERAVRYARALNQGLAEVMPHVGGTGLLFNRYVRDLDDGNVELWILPAGQVDGRLVFGGEARFVLESQGRTILERQIAFDKLMVAEPGPERSIDIDRQDRDLPRVGDLFFVLQFGDQFEQVSIWSECYLSRYLDVGEHEPFWVHAERETRECKKKAKRLRKARRRNNE